MGLAYHGELVAFCYLPWGYHCLWKILSVWGFHSERQSSFDFGSFIRSFYFWSGSHDDGVAVDQFQYSCLQTANIIVSDPASFAFLRGGAGGSDANKGKKKVNLLIQSLNEVIEKFDVKIYNMNRTPILLLVHPT